MLTHPSSSLPVKMRFEEANDVLATQAVTGLLHGVPWPSMTFPNSTPHPPPSAAAVTTKCFSRHLLPRVTWNQAFLFSLAHVVGLRLVRSLVLLIYTFSNPQKQTKTMKFIQKEKNMQVKVSKEVFVQLTEILRRPEAWTDN